MLCHLFTVENRIGKLFSCIFRMGRHEAYQEISLYPVKLPEKLRETHFAVKIIAVGIDILTEEHNFLVAVLHEFTHFIDDVLRFSAPLSASYVGNDAVCTEIVASEHYWH